MIDAYALSLAALLLTAGSLADRFGRRRRVRDRHRRLHARLAAVRRRRRSDVPRAARARPGRRRRDHVRHRRWRCSRQRVPRRATAAPRSASSAPSPASPWPSARCSAARSPAACRGAGSSSSTSRSAIVALAVDAAARRRVARPARRAGSTASASSRSAPASRALVFGLIRSNEDGWGSTHRRRLAGRRRRAARSPSWSPSTSSASRCSTSRCCAMPTFVGGLIAAFGDLGVAVRAAHLPRALHPERARLLGDRGRRAVPAAHRRDLPHRRRSPGGCPRACRRGC